MVLKFVFDVIVSTCDFKIIILITGVFHAPLFMYISVLRNKLI